MNMSETQYKVYEVIVLERSKKVKDEEEQPPKLVLGPTAVVARNEQDAAIKTILGEDNLKEIDKDRLELKVRPF